MEAKKIFKKLVSIYPEAKCSLDFKNPFELVVATILSAQCTDVRVNKVTPILFQRYPDALSLSQANIAELESIIKSTGFYKNKAKSLLRCARQIVDQHSGNVPSTMEQLVELAGVGRKTANVVLGSAFGLPGLPVDTHVGRLSRRMGLTKSKDPVKIELELQKMIEPADWIRFSNVLIYHGRARCDARKPDCIHCELKKTCPQKI